MTNYSRVFQQNKSVLVGQFSHKISSSRAFSLISQIFSGQNFTNACLLSNAISEYDGIQSNISCEVFSAQKR